MFMFITMILRICPNVLRIMGSHIPRPIENKYPWERKKKVFHDLMVSDTRLK
jgi:hypothetical protein